MKKYFELRENGVLLFGVIDNIPEDTEIETIKERVETQGVDTLELVDYILFEDKIDIEIDWSAIDNEEGMNQDIIKIQECLNESLIQGNESEMVFAALQVMKNDSDLTISEAIEKGLKLTIN